MICEMVMKVKLVKRNLISFFRNKVCKSIKGAMKLFITIVIDGRIQKSEYKATIEHDHKEVYQIVHILDDNSINKQILFVTITDKGNNRL